MASLAPPTSPPHDPPSGPSPRPPDQRPLRLARGLAKGIALLILLAAAAVLLQSLWGAGDRYSWLFLAGGGALGLLTTSAGWLVALRIRASADGGRPGLLAWLAFPVCVLCFPGMITLLLLAAVPEMRSRLDPGDLIVASRRGDHLEIIFPQPTAGNAINIQLDDRPIPAEFIRGHPELFEWKHLGLPGDNRRLVLDLAAIRRELGIPPPRAVRINASIDIEPLKDLSGRRLLPQMILVPST